MNIRKASREDLSRIGEIYVFNNRANYYPVFKDKIYSFSNSNFPHLIGVGSLSLLSYHVSIFYTLAGCWVHCRRRFDEALKLIPKSYQKESNTFLLMKQIQAIYREEGKLNDLSSDERLKQRQAVIKPLVDAFFFVPENHKCV